MSADKKLVGIAGIFMKDNEGRYLMVQEKGWNYGLWGVPGGHIDEGETPQAAAVREAKEEVGITVRLIDENPFYVEQDDQKHRLYHGFLAENTDGEIEINKDELLDARWIGLSEIKSLDAQNKIRSPWITKAILKAEAQ